MLTIVYCTARPEPHIDWMFDSLCAQDLTLDFDLVVVDALRDQRPPGWMWSFARHVAPKPTPWQGPWRQTKVDWFAMASARNTGLCYAHDGHVAFVDDLSVLDPNWTKSVRDAVDGNYCVAGAYRKAYDMYVKYGHLESYRIASEDCRWNQQGIDLAECPGGWLYGCSCVFPVQDLLDVNGWPEFCDGLGMEDVCLGKILVKAGKKLKYDKRMMTTESAEGHIISPRMKMMDKGISPHDKSHAAVHKAEQIHWSPNEFNIGNERRQIQHGGFFSKPADGAKDWYDGQLLSEME